MISLELSMVQHNRFESARLAVAMEEFLSRGGQVTELGVTTFNPAPFNNEVLPPSSKVSKAVKIAKSEKALAYEREIAERLKGYTTRGIAVAAKEMHLSTRRLNFIAEAYGVTLAATHSDSARRRAQAENKRLAPIIQEMFKAGRTQMEVVRELGLNRDRLRKMAKTEGFELPGMVDEHEDRKLIERITAFRDLGLARSVCAKRIGISPKKLIRIIEAYDIDFPAKGAE